VELAAEVLPFEQIYDRLDAADIVITTTGSPEPIFRREHGQQLLQRRRNRPVFFIDIAVPRDVDPAMAKLEGIFVYDIDDLQSVASQNQSGRNEEARHAERIIEREVERYKDARQSLDAVPSILAVQRSLESLRQQEHARNAARLAGLDAEERKAVDDLTRSLLNKLLHGPMVALKAAARDGDEEAMRAIRQALAGDSVDDAGEDDSAEGGTD
jgi:glutamyl-tRNA reductase